MKPTRDPQPHEADELVRGIRDGGGDELVRGISDDGGVAVRAIVGTALVREAQGKQSLSATATTALGRALMGSALVAAGAQEGETVQIQLRGHGPLGNLIAIAEADGRVRGTVSNPEVELADANGRVNVSAAIGRGILAVVRSHPRWKEPYRGIIPLESGEVALDIARYLTDSEQTPSAVGLGVALGPGGVVEGAGGFLVQALPGADDAVLERIERNLGGLSAAELVRDGADGTSLLGSLLEGVGGRALHRSTPRFECPCERDRVARMVLLLGRDELSQAVAARDDLEVRCEFCGERYVLGPDEVGALLPDA